jgi:hypothetical protein
MNSRYLPTLLLLAIFETVCVAQRIAPTPPCAQADKGITYRIPPLTYPMTSDRYSVQYQLGAGAWTDVPVHISYYGGTNATPNNSSSGYVPDTSMSFASIPVSASTAVALRITKLWGSPFPALSHISVRPTPKGIHVDSVNGDLVQISTTTAADFAGEQFLLWWDGDTQQSSSIQSLVFFLNPPYAKPMGSNVKVINASADLTGDISSFDTLDFEGTIVVGPTGASAFVVPANIRNVFLGPSAWVQGKLRFAQNGNGNLRHVYGPGVLDVSRFEYDLRACDDNSTYPEQGYEALSWEDPPSKTDPDTFLLEGIVITDHNHAVADSLANSVVNNVNSIGWNGLNGGFRIGDNTKLSNLFIRAGDDSLMMWGAFDTVLNATVWQDYNGAPVNLGWGNDSPGDYGLIDGLYVVKTDWSIPTVPSWNATGLNGQNDAVIASLMTPGTAFGTVQPPLFRNIFVEDPPQTLLSLKITFPECVDPNSPRFGSCLGATLADSSVVNLNIENLSSPPSVGANSIGFQVLPPGFSDEGQSFPLGYTLTGSMNIGFSNVTMTSPNGGATTLTSSNAATIGKIGTNGGPIIQRYDTPSAAQALAQVAAGGTLTTGIFVLNTSTAQAQFTLQFYDDQGNPLALPFTTGSASTLSGSLPPQGSAYYEASNASIATLAGWARITSDSPIVVQALFRNAVNGTYYEAAVPSTPVGSEFVIPFDATTFAATGQPFVTGVAIANLDATLASVTCTAYDSNGVIIPNAVLVPTLAPLGHWSAFAFPLLNGIRGTMDCTSNTNISGLALRALGSELTSLPVVTNPANLTSSTQGAIAQVAAGGGLTTGFFFLNTGNTAANYSMNLSDDGGNPVSFPFASGKSKKLTGTIPAHGLAYYETVNPQQALVQGWGSINADAPIVVQALFRNAVNGTYYEAAIPSTPGSGNEALFPFDSTTFAGSGQALVTGIAIANLDGVAANVICVARDQNGVAIPDAVQVPALPAQGHWAGYQFPALNGQRGTIDCSSNTNISGTALRFLGSALSSLPVVTK